jgi:hypothetical protein
MRNVLIPVAIGLGVFALIRFGGFLLEDTSPDMAEIEREIRPELKKQVNEMLKDEGVAGKARVREVQCVRRSDTRARCTARLVGSNTEVGKTRLAIDVTIDPSDGSYLWEVDR